MSWLMTSPSPPPPPTKTHEEMLAEQVCNLEKIGDNAGAAKVQKILHEHLRHQAMVSAYPSTIYDAMNDRMMPYPSAPRPYTYEERLAMRMQWGRIEDSKWAPGFNHVAIHAVGDKVHVWVITTNGQSVVLEDEGPLFPSDTLITKLNTIKE